MIRTKDEIKNEICRFSNSQPSKIGGIPELLNHFKELGIVLHKNDLLNYLEEIQIEMPNHINWSPDYGGFQVKGIDNFLASQGFVGSSKRIERDNLKLDLEIKAYKSTINKNSFDKYVAYISLAISIIAVIISIYKD